MKSSYVAAVAISMLLCFGPLASAADSAADATSGPQKAALHATIETCGTCHGVNGRSISPTFPNLAAQSAPYIELQLHAFKNQTRADPDAQAYMWGMASPLDDAMISALAGYFAAQPAARGASGNAALMSEGKRLFEQGIPEREIPPCASCHGAHAEGLASFPRLAGQHSAYLLKQLLVIQSALRTAPVMHGVVKDLTREQMLALVTYLESI